VRLLLNTNSLAVYRLASLYDGELKRLTGVRIAVWFAFLVSAVALLLMAFRQLSASGVVAVAVEALAWLSWLVGGLVTLSAVRHWNQFQAPLRGLASQFGIPASTQKRAAPLALLFRLALLLATPAFLLACGAVLLAAHGESLLARLTLLWTMPLYAMLLAFGLSVLAQALSALTTASRASWLCACVLGPHLLRELWPATPSLIHVYDWLLQHLAQFGGGA
jgi:hypothetical protein